MPRSFYWLAGRPPPPSIPEDESVQHTARPVYSDAERAAMHHSLFAWIDSLLGTNSPLSFLGTSAAPGGVATEADASEATGEPQPAPEPDPTSSAPVHPEALPAVGTYDEPEGQPEEELDQD